MLRVNILSNDKDIIIKLPKSSHELAAELRKAGIDISPERLTLKSNVGHNYLIGLYTEDPLGDVVIDRICDNDNLAELNKLCQVFDKASDRDIMMRTLLNSDVHCINGIKKLFADRFMEFVDKLVLNTNLERKPTDFSVKGCIIEKAVPVSHSKFKAIANVPLRDEPLIAQYSNVMYADSNDMCHCILIYDKDFGDGNLKIQLKAASLAEKEHAWSIVLDAWRLYKERENDPELIDAVLFFYLMKCSYSATGTSWACKAVNRESMVRLINEASRMMQGITVENKDCIELIKLHDDPSTFVYCDPPYYMAEALYNGVPLFGDAKHIELHDTLMECKSDVLLSYNECPFIDELYSESKWYKMRLSRPHSMVLHRGSGAVYNEFLIANYDIYKLYNGDGQLTFLELFDDFNEEGRIIL